MKNFLLLLMLLPVLTLVACGGDDKDEPKPDTDKYATRVITVEGISFKMIKVEGGTYTMGAKDDDNDAWSNEKPAHQVTVSTFAIGETEVTQELWQAVMGSNPSYFSGAKNPVEMVNWEDCQEFIGRLNNLTGMKFRMPTEAEWEYAARGGKNSKDYTCPGGNIVDDVAWYSNNSNNKTHVVAAKAPNELGLYDMCGNVNEWCQDWFDGDYYSNSPKDNPKGPSSPSTWRVFRGGDWNDGLKSCRISYRNGGIPTKAEKTKGLRLAL